MKRFLLLAVFIIFQTMTSIAQTDFRIHSIKRKFKDNSEWVVETSRGAGTLRNVYGDGREWMLTIPNMGKYTLSRPYATDPGEWRITDGKSEMFFALSFPPNFNEWRTGNETGFVYVKTVYSNSFGEWEAEGSKGKMAIKSTFSDGSEWKVQDNITGETAMTKLSIAFIPVATFLFGKKSK